MYPTSGTITDEVTFRNADGTLYDPTSVVLEVRNPNGVLSYPTTTRISLGVWRANFTLTRGVWRWGWDGITGSIHDVVTGGTCSAQAVTV